MLQLEVELILHEVSHAVGVYLIELGDEGRGDEAMLQSQPDLFATAEYELVEVVENEFQSLGVPIVDLYDLADAASVEGLVLDAAEIAENLLYFLLHSIIYISLYPRVFK